MLRLTNSEKGSYQRCKRMWWIQYYRRLKPVRESVTTSSYLGTVVHDALAAYYDPDLRGDPVVYVEMNRLKCIEERPVDEDDINKQHEMASIMVEGYVEWLAETGEDSDLIIEGAESMAEANLAPDITLLSKLDAPVTLGRDGSKWAIEHKTTGSIEARTEGAQINSQFLTEHLVRFLIERERGATDEEAFDACQGVLLNMLRKVKRTARSTPPFYAREPVRHNLEELRNHWRHVLTVAREIQETTARLDAGESHQVVVPPTPMDGDCSWRCDLYKICHMADDGSDFEGALSAMFEEKDPLERYEGAKPL